MGAAVWRPAETSKVGDSVSDLGVEEVGSGEPVLRRRVKRMVWEVWWLLLCGVFAAEDGCQG